MTDRKTQTTDLFKKARSLAAKLRTSGRYSAMDIFSVLQAVYSSGYSDGYEDQMRARILDAQERRNGKS